MVQSIDPDDIPIFSLALTLTPQPPLPNTPRTSSLGEGESTSDLIQIRKVALDIIEKLKTVPNTTLWYQQGGQSEQVVVDLDLDALAAKQVDVMQVIQTLQKQQANFPIGSLKL